MSRRSPGASSLRAVLAEALPELWCEGSWLVLSKRLAQPGRAPVYVHVLIDIRAGTCLVAALDDAPLGTRVGSWLDTSVTDGQRPVRVFTDDPTTVHMGALASWGLAREVSTECHPGSTAPSSVSMVMQSLADAVNAMPAHLGKDAAVASELENWRQHYNNALVGRPAPTRGSHGHDG